MTVSKNIIGGASLGILVGTLQTTLLQQYADIPMGKAYLTAGGSASNAPKPFLMGMLKNFGSPSAFIGIVTGVVATAFGAYSSMNPRYIRSDLVNSAILAYGVTALLGGILSGIFPKTSWYNAVGADPSNPVGYNPGYPKAGVIIRPASTSVTTGTSPGATYF